MYFFHSHIEEIELTKKARNDEIEQLKDLLKVKGEELELAKQSHTETLKTKDDEIKKLETQRYLHM